LGNVKKVKVSRRSKRMKRRRKFGNKPDPFKQGIECEPANQWKKTRKGKTVGLIGKGNRKRKERQTASRERVRLAIGKGGSGNVTRKEAIG